MRTFFAVYFLYLAFILAPVAVVFLSLFLGYYPLTGKNIITVLWHTVTGSGTTPPEVHVTIVSEIRLPLAIILFNNLPSIYLFAFFFGPNGCF